MGQKKASKRKNINPKVEDENEKDEHVPDNAKNSDIENLIVTQINVDEDATDEEVGEDAIISSSDEEKDLVVFDSDEDETSDYSEDTGSENSNCEETQEDLLTKSNDEQLRNKSKSKESLIFKGKTLIKKNLEEDAIISSSDEIDDLEDAGSESSYNEEVQENLSTKLKNAKLKEKNKSKEFSTFKAKTSTKEITQTNKLKTNKNRRDSKHNNYRNSEAQTSKDDVRNKRETRNILNNANGKDEYEDDSSDEEDIRNTVGNIPMKWYDEYDHVGYDWEGKKIPKPEKGDELDNFLKRMEDPDFWRTIKDPQTGRDIVLSEADIDLIVRIQKQKVPDIQFDEYAPWVDWFTSEVMKTPLRKFPEHKRSFLPSKNEARKVSKLVHALKMGWIKSTAEMQKERKKSQGPQFYMLWQSDDQAEEMRRIHKHIPAPKRHLPGHAESYNPPPEYLFDNKELKEWNKLKVTPWKRKLHFIPQKFNSLREVPAYSRYIKERFQRCIDLYLCTRSLKMKLTIEPEVLVPQLPSPKDLQPFPTTMFMVFKGHTDMIRSITAEPEGQFIASGGDDMLLKIWEVNTGRCLKTIPCGGVIRSVAWRPNQAMSLIAVAADKKVLLINPGVGDNLITSKTDQLLEIIPQSEIIVSDRVQCAVQWEQVDGEHWSNGIRIILNHFKTVKQVTWHGKGDYFATVMPDGQNRSVLINQLSKRRSQLPFNKSKGLIQCVLFHPIRPYLFVATQRNVRIYDLVQQVMVKKLLSNSQWISSMDIHPGGDNVLVGTYDRKMLWFDLDFSKEPYQTLRLHGTGVRAVAFHKRYPLFASGADDRALIVSHGMVYNDLLQNPLIVPLKRLCNHESYNDFGILDVMFHPIEPWIFSAGADFTIRMYT
ncbi:ribosome biogenesis protein BOP1 homolog [Monomorium pharaonis]|uniref:ribosome biogenesis protein BOP1 homolog n=1 Tax=Monomorium pharaonis TaxID=307658 RepID=UPI00063FBF6F|nr:ribosome biogenesis protein BOP1 homolog [Monomorium pharaonis]